MLTTNFVVIAGPCLIEGRDLTLRIADELCIIVARLQQRFTFDFVFKASFDKANRTSNNSKRGPGIQAGLKILEEIKKSYNVPITTDIHECHQALLVREVVDVIQIPAFLCRQSDLLVAAAQTGRVVNVKKGQFLAPRDMEHVAIKLHAADCHRFWFTERGTSFGYGSLVNDMTGIPQMKKWAPVIFDATHSVQKPGGLGGSSDGCRGFIPVLAGAAVAAGCDGLFFETHPDPDSAPSDGPNMVPLKDFEALLNKLLSLRALVEKL
jgi:2-dehydro-3-deoxyphosphooctonate aldolase (KDO 8-P synthase)